MIKRTDGRFEPRLQRAWSDGTTQLMLDGQEFIARLASLVPPPPVARFTRDSVF